MTYEVLTFPCAAGLPHQYLLSLSRKSLFSQRRALFFRFKEEQDIYTDKKKSSLELRQHPIHKKDKKILWLRGENKKEREKNMFMLASTKLHERLLICSNVKKLASTYKIIIT